VADAVNGAPVDFTTAVGRSVGATELLFLNASSGGQVSPTPELSGHVLILVQTDGSQTSLTLNARGLVCTPACDGTTAVLPDPTDHFVVYSVVGPGTRNAGDAFVVTRLRRVDQGISSARFADRLSPW
jgi:hypothetical protein